MSQHSFRMQGFTLLELVIVLAILTVIIGMVVASLGGFREEHLLVGTSEDIVVLLENARQQTIGSENSSQYGVHIDTDYVALFVGATYDPDALMNQVLEIDARLSIESVSLLGGGNDVVFDRITGETSQPGSFDVFVANDSSKRRTITIEGTGFISLE